MSGPQHAAKPARRGSGGPTGSRLMLIAISLALVVFLLGAVVLYLKLKPQDTVSSLSGSFLQSARNAVAAQPDDPWAHVGLGVALADSGDKGAAEGEFEKALELDKTNWQANMQLATLIGDDDPERAIKLLQTSAKYSSSPETPYLLLGDFQYKLGHYDEAKVAYLRSIAIEQAMYDSRMGLAKTYEAMGEKKLALDQFKFALRIAPGDEAAKEAIARLTGRSDGAKEPAATASPSAEGA